MTTLPKFIEKRGNRYAVRFSKGMLPDGRRRFGSYDTIEDAVAARDAELRRALGEPEVEGLTNCDTDLDPDELWAAAFRAQLQTEEVHAKRYNRSITIPGADKPFALAFLSDLHFGSADTDYRKARADAEIIRDTDRMWCGYHGDGIDNWIMGKLAGLQRGQAMPFDAEVQLFADWLGMLKGKLLWAVAGNHDNWTVKLSGFDLIAEALRGTRVLYDRYEVVFELRHGETTTRVKVRHQWKYSSVFNATHGVEVSWERGGADFDIGLGGHTHIGTLCRPFLRHGRQRYAILTGTYKVDGDFGRKLGLPLPHGHGSGAMVFYPDGGGVFIEDLKKASDFLRFLLG